MGHGEHHVQHRCRDDSSQVPARHHLLQQDPNYDNGIPYNHRDHLVGGMCQPIWKIWGLVTWDGYSRWKKTWKNHQDSCSSHHHVAVFHVGPQTWLGPLGPAWLPFPDGILGSSPIFPWRSWDFPVTFVPTKPIKWTISSHIIPI